MPETLKRIVVLGNSGAGKSTFSRAIGQALDIPVVHTDTFKFVHGEHWQLIEKETIRNNILAHVGSMDVWVYENTSASQWQQPLFDQADSIIYLDIPVWQCFWNILKRVWTYHGTDERPDTAPGCTEHLNIAFLWDIISQHSKRRTKVLDLLKAYPVTMLSSYTACDQWLEKQKTIA